jgi:hypothetical protein
MGQQVPLNGNLSSIDASIMTLEVVTLNDKRAANNFTWQVTAIKGPKLIIQLHFAEPHIISKGSTIKDELRITFLSNFSLVDISIGFYIP